MVTSRKRGGFTLLEVLTAIAVVAIVTSILFPVFASVRERARQGVCLSNLRQLGQALTMYREEHASYPPFHAHPKALAPYVKDRRLFFCPSWKPVPGIGLLSSYVYLLNGDQVRDGGNLEARSVIMYCGDHTKLERFERDASGHAYPVYSGIYSVLRHDGATELVPAARVKVSSRSISAPEARVKTRLLLFHFPE
jgi:prepilin-type N-terminal cleavage/methylation domain-containing protein